MTASLTNRSIDGAKLQAHRARTFRLATPLRLRSREEAEQFVRERGFVFLWPINGVPLPNLWQAVVGERPVASAHDDPGHVTWSWKDEALGKRRWYYAKILRGKATLISLETAPLFYALSENYGDPENDYLQLYEDGLLSRPAKQIYEALLQEGPLSTVTLRRTAGMTGKGNKSAFDRGLTELQRDLKILPVGLAQAGAWRYSFIYDLTHRHFPNLPGQARQYSRQKARCHLLRRYFASLGAARTADVQRLFQWRPVEITSALEAITAAGEVVEGYKLNGEQDNYFVIRDLVDSL